MPALERARRATYVLSMAETGFAANELPGYSRPVLPRRFRGDMPVVPVVRLAGVIGFSTPLRPGLTLASVAKPLDRAFAWPRARAVALLINSPGGSAVQSHLVFQRIRQLAAEKDRPVIAFVEDVAASGGYMIACAADEIVADPSSIVGSIGVIGASFGFAKLIDKIGVERRIYTSGTNKAMLDPFLPENPDHVARLKAIQEDIHASFIDLVKSRARRKAHRARAGAVLGRVLGRPQGHRIRPGGPHRRPALDLARALRRQGRDAAGDRRRAACSGACAGRRRCAVA